MSRAVVTRTIDAPRETVFAFLDEPPNQVRVAPSVVGIGAVQPTDDGKRLLYGYNAFGIVFTGSLETTTYDPPARMVFQMDGDVTGQITWELAAIDEKTTRFSYASTYDLSGFPGAGLLRRAFAWYNRRELQTTVANVEKAIERGEQTRADFQRSSVTEFDPASEPTRPSVAGEPTGATDEPAGDQSARTE